ncbi:hypothetical protein B0H13DRAFT_2357909 [Mycena leptocephala]|nr:hypothetical protein B0H13DRAFT_2357909 [Mycena leptocephala]
MQLEGRVLLIQDHLKRLEALPKLGTAARRRGLSNANFCLTDRQSDELTSTTVFSWNHHQANPSDHRNRELRKWFSLCLKQLCALLLFLLYSTAGDIEKRTIVHNREETRRLMATVALHANPGFQASQLLHPQTSARLSTDAKKLGFTSSSLIRDAIPGQRAYTQLFAAYAHTDDILDAQRPFAIAQKMSFGDLRVAFLTNLQHSIRRLEQLLCCSAL